MMQFLRKHQKKLFLVIAVMTIASFTFFGTFSTFSAPEIPNKKIGQALDGSAIYERDLRALAQFLSLGSSEILRSDLVETGAFSLLAERYFNEIQEDFQERLQKARGASFYSHPQAPFLNALQVWNRFSPQLAGHLKDVQSGDLSAKTFSAYAHLYLDQQAFPPELLRTILLYEQQNYSWVSPDYQLADARYLSLFGYQTFEEWFGSRFSDLLGKFIFNTAAIAEKKGYKVSQKEARTDLMMNCYQAVQMKSMKKEVSSREATDFMRLQFQMVGIDESRAVQLWRKVMLMHRFFHDIEQGVLLDPLPYEQFSLFADAKASVEVYQLPEALRLKDFRSMLKVQYYLEAVSPKGQQSISDLPRQFYSVEEVEKKHPQLVISRYELEVAQASQEDILSRLSLKQTWDFEISDAGWGTLTGQFPILKKPGTESTEGRLQALDQMDHALRAKIDRYARQSILKQHPEWIEEALRSKEAEKVTVDIRSKGAVIPFNDIEETAPLRQTLEKATLGEIVTFVAPGATTYYQIKVLQKPERKEIMTLQKALEHDVLGKLLDEKLEGALIEARKKDSGPYKASDGSWKSFSEVKDHVGAYVYADLLKMISPTALPYDEYAAKRFEQMMQQAKTSIQEQQEASKFLSEAHHELIDQWRLLKRQLEIKRSDTTHLPKTEMFSSPLGSWSSVATPRGGDIAFFHLLKREASDPSIYDQVQDGQKLMGRDITKQMIQTLLDEVMPL